MANIFLAALLEQEDGLVQPLLQKLGVPIAKLSADLGPRHRATREGARRNFLRYVSW